MFKQIVFWLLVMGLGCLMMYYSWSIVDFLWRSVRADEHLWGTKNAVVLFWLLVFIIGWLMLFGIVPTSNPVNSIPAGF